MRRARIPFRYCQPAFFGGLLDDPLLFLRIRPLRRALLFDCGQIAHLAKRVIKPIDAVFITHAHMDHIMGLPTLVRHHHASPKPLDVFGPPGLAERVQHLLGGFDWNLTEPTWFTLRVHEVHPHLIRRYHFPGPQGFRRFIAGEEPRESEEIWNSRYVSVSAALLDHKLPVLAYRVDEMPFFIIDHQRLEAEGLVAGDWLIDLKTAVWRGMRDHPVRVLRRTAAGIEEYPCPDPEALYRSIRGTTPCASIGYMTDVGWTEGNREVMGRFLDGLTLLCIECTFLAGDREKARASYHLCTQDINRLAQVLRPRWLLAMHLSKSYLRHTVDLYAELQPPAGTVLLKLPGHIVPPPLGVEDVERWMMPEA